MKTNYEGHDKAYRQKKADGELGWDNDAAEYDSRVLEIQDHISQGRLPANGQWIELGCGAGNLSIALAESGLGMTGVDISPTAIEWAKETALSKGLEISFLVGSVLQLDAMRDESFDVVLDGHCYHCIIGEDRMTFLNEAKRLLKPEGSLLIDTMVGPVQGNEIQGYDQESQCTMFSNTATRYFVMPAQLETEIRMAGFQISWKQITSGDAHGMMQIICEKA